MSWPFGPNSIAVAAPISAALVNASPAGTSLWPRAVNAAPYAVMNSGSEVTLAVLRGLVRGASIKRKDTGAIEEASARDVVVADGANSRFGRALGTSRDKTYPQGMAIRGYYESPMHDDPWIESALDVLAPVQGEG